MYINICDICVIHPHHLISYGDVNQGGSVSPSLIWNSSSLGFKLKN